MSELLPHIFIVLLIMLVVAFFAGVEIAFLASSLVKIELKARQGSVSAGILSHFKKHVSKVLITILVGLNLALILYTQQIDYFFAFFYERIFGVEPSEHDLFLTFIKAVIDTLILLILAEYIPKALFRRLADTIIYPSAYILQAFYWILWIPVQALHFTTKFLFGLIGIPMEDRFVGINKEELETYLQELIDTSEANEMQEVDTEILTNAMAFSEIKVREMMIPRTQMVALPIDSEPQALMDLFINSKHSRILIYQEDIDHIQGFVHSTGMFGKPKEILSLIQPVLVVPEVMSADVLLKEFADKKRSMAIVVDEFGGTSGLVTVEDLVEEIFGDIEDEYDEEDEKDIEEDMIFIENEDKTMIIGARQSVFDLNENHNLNLPESEHYTTLGGLILQETEEIPHEGDVLSNISDKYEFTILKASPTKIIKVKVRRRDKEG
jgi:putative hemolysin